ncbi:MAG: SurA N-terminal domain-containing protein [Betaproteobacteria bacterium]|nr:SurA N-terminal domain-containing protein [Betaproteobacteria bacterium]
MFDFVTRHKRLIQVVLAVIFLPFAFFGIDTYFRGGGGSQTVAEVGGHGISQQEFDQALRQRQQLLQRLAQGRVDPAMLDNPELRYATLEGLVQRRLLLERALAGGMAVSDEQLQGAIGGMPVFNDESGKFSINRYDMYLKAEGMNRAAFEARVRQDLILRHLTDGYGDNYFVPRTVADRLARLAGQSREVSTYAIPADRYLGQVKLDAAAAKQYYDANPGEFQVAERVRVEYIALSVDALLPQAQIGREELEGAYQRQVVGVKKERDEAQKRAERILGELRKAPGSFEALARKHSQDPGSAERGGDLGFFGKGAMARPFEDAVFRLKEGEIGPLVATEFGFHIIKLTGKRPVAGAKGQTAEERRASHILLTAPKDPGPQAGRNEIELELKRQAAQKRFAEVADNFNNLVYEQSESLKPAAELAKIAPRQSGWITRGQADDPLLNNPKLLAAIFSDDVLKNRRNTEAIDVAPNTLVAARVLEHKPASMPPFAEVRAAIEKKLTLREAARLAAQEGRSQLEQLRQGKDARIAWGAPQTVSRSDHKDLTEPVLRALFRADASKLPAYAGVEGPQGGYTLLRIARVTEPADVPDDRRRSMADSLRQVLGQEQLAAYIASLKQQARIRISKEALEKKDR